MEKTTINFTNLIESNAAYEKERVTIKNKLERVIKDLFPGSPYISANVGRIDSNIPELSFTIHGKIAKGE